MFQKIRKSRYGKAIAISMAIMILVEVINPVALMALTSGPSQPEVQSFTQASVSDMVDVFSGDFSYNIPLMDVGGYPINLNYGAGINMDQEASWVGLGWNINPGVINRNMRSIPDDFNGERITKEFNIKNNDTYGVAGTIDLELFGIKAGKLSVGENINYNNYKGFGFGFQLEPSISASNACKSSCTLGLGLSASSETGVSITPSVSFERYIVNDNGLAVGKGSFGAGLSINSRAGLKQLSIFGGKTENYNHKVSSTINRSNGGGSYSFAGVSYTPEISMSMVNFSASLNVTLGADLFGGHPDIRVNGYYSSQRLASNSESQPAYGYFYAQNNKMTNPKVLLDFNREADRSFTKHTPNLPVTNFTYDVFTVSGQGLSGSYRPFRGDLGVVYDSQNSNNSNSIDLPGVEFGAGNLVHAGINFTINTSTNISGNWKSQNDVINTLKFRSNSEISDPLYEPCYFKQAGEKTPETDPSFFNKIGNYSPVRVKIDNGTDNPARNTFVFPDKSELPFNFNNVRTKRARRNQSFVPMVASYAKDYGVIKDIESYGLNQFALNSDGNYTNKQLIPRVGGTRKPYHLSEITTYKPDGTKYVFGIPAYNNTQEDVTFAITGGSPSLSTGLVGYNHGSDNTVNNAKGEDNYYNKTTLPAYSHSFLLTSVFSPDYVDVKGDGPTTDDLGSYTKINYTRAYTDYKWRVPFEANKASYNEGLKTKPNNNPYTDDKASYLYGEKEIWYVHSIESKTMVAEFILADRVDGFGVIGSMGGKGTQPLKKLVRIELYSKNDKVKYGSNAIPIKTVHFEYDYSLCNGIPNNDTNAKDMDENNHETGFLNQGGKLTLKRVYFTFQKSNRGKFSPYEFDYGQVWKKDGTQLATINPRYNLKEYDRWGTYKPNPSNTDPKLPTNAESPYTNQDLVTAKDVFDGQSIYESGNDRYMADIYAVSWNMTSIGLPSGGLIKVDYEADDYSYVQNRRAMQMFRVVGTLGGSEQFTVANAKPLLYSSDLKSRDYLVIELPKEYTKTDFKKDFLTNNGQLIKNLNFKFLVNLGKSEDAANEYVNGWAQLDVVKANSKEPYGLIDPTHAYIKVKEIELNDNISKGPKANPIAQAAWNFAKLNVPRIAYGQPDPSSNGVVQIFDAMLSTLKQIVDFAAGYNYMMRLYGKGNVFDTNKSWVRLYTPDGVKKGGGHRVKRIVMNDQWKEMVGNANYKSEEYGQEYIYSTVENKETLSSGVASYEPLIGGNENPFKQPITFSEKNLLAPSEDYFLEEPIGESLFPSPNVGYRKVTVQNLKRQNVSSHATGTVVHEFYTAKDFPTLRSETNLENVHIKSNPVITLLNIDSKDFMTASQGYAIELNDMHGKAKSMKVYQEDGKFISGTEYKYKVNGAKLDNTANVIEKDGTMHPVEIGVDYDFVVDNRQQESTNITTGLNGNLETFLAFIFPVFVPVILPKFAYDRMRFRSIATTKVINRYALLDEVINYDQGSVVSSKNEMYDAETGEVLLTKTINAHNDAIYNFTYPAHWAYEGLGPVYKTIGAEFTGPTTMLVPGEQVEFDVRKGISILGGTKKTLGWVTQTQGGLAIVDNQGRYYQVPNKCKVIRPGRKNMQSTPVGTITCGENPVKINNGKYYLEFNKVLNASAVEYTDEAGLFCKECGFEPGKSFNPYLLGSRGNWKTKTNYVYLTDRTQTRMNNNTNIRKDGMYTDFEPYWMPNKGGDWERNIYTPKWVYTAQATIFSPFGPEVETQDALGRYNSAVFGYNYLLPVATGSNSMYKEIAFDGAEDYNMSQCADSHFSFEKSIKSNTDGTVSVSETESHTGKRSIMVKPASVGSVRKVLIPCQDK